jgi:hypothetical protein
VGGPVYMTRLASVDERRAARIRASKISETREGRSQFGSADRGDLFLAHLVSSTGPFSRKALCQNLA